MRNGNDIFDTSAYADRTTVTKRSKEEEKREPRELRQPESERAMRLEALLGGVAGLPGMEDATQLSHGAGRCQLTDGQAEALMGGVKSVMGKPNQ